MRLTAAEHLMDAQDYLKAATRTTTAHRLDDPHNAVQFAIANAVIGLLVAVVEGQAE